MSMRKWLGAPSARRGIAASIFVLSAGGLVLHRASADAHTSVVLTSDATPQGDGATSFSGPGAHGSIALSGTKLLAGEGQRLYAELLLVADRSSEVAERAPLSLVVVLDTSGSMEGEKIAQAKESVTKLVREMRDDDEIALVRYSDSSELLQPLARVGAVRESLTRRIADITSDGGTAIPAGLERGIQALSGAGKGRVRRVVLVSDGLDSTRAEAERLASNSAERGVTISSMGIGLDFDEAYMGGVARSGHGNFGFVRDGAALATFLHRELDETAATTIERATARVRLPRGIRFVRAVGADAKEVDGGAEIELGMGSLFAGDERRVLIELSASLDAGEVRGLEGSVGWTRVGGEAAEARFDHLDVAGTNDPREVEAAQRLHVVASAVSALASLRQMQAAEAYDKGDSARAQALIQENLSEIRAAATAMPAPLAAPLEAQAAEYAGTGHAFASAPPSSTAGKVAAKKAVSKEHSNLARKAAY